MVEAVTFINHKLNDSGWFETVSTSDLLAITDKLKSLTPAQRNEFIGALDEQALYKWADRIGSPWPGTGLNGMQKFDLLAMLIPAMDKHNLIRLGKAIVEADTETANKEFIRALIFTWDPSDKNRIDSLSIYWHFMEANEHDSKFEKQLKSYDESAPDVVVAKLIGSIPLDVEKVDNETNRDHLIELTRLLGVLRPDDRAWVFSNLHGDAKWHGLLRKLAAGIVTSDLSKREKQELFDLLSRSMSESQLADLQMALSACDFIRKISLAINLSQRTGGPVVFDGGATDELGKFLENYTNKRSLQRAANDPSINPVKRLLAKHIGPMTPSIRANGTPAPISPNAKLLMQSVLKNTAADPKRKVNYLQYLMSSTSGIFPEVKAYNLELAQEMVADEILITVFNTLSANEKAKYGKDLMLSFELAKRVNKLRSAENYFSPEKTTETNSTAEALWIVKQASSYIEACSQRLGIPRPLLQGVLASEVQFDQPEDVMQWRDDPTQLLEQDLFRVQDVSFEIALDYLGRRDVKKDLEAAHLDGLLSYLKINDVTVHPQMDPDAGRLEENFAAVVLLRGAHQLWTAGKKIPESKVPSNFGEFLKDMSASDMASVFEAYRAGVDFSDTDEAGYDAERRMFKVKGGEEFAEAVGDPDAKAGYNAYQSYPYFKYFLAKERKRSSS